MLSSFSEQYCSYVSSRGLLKGCDIRSNVPQSSASVLHSYNHELSDLPSGTATTTTTTIYVCSSAIKDFMRHVHAINYRFILVSGDSDTTIPNGVLSDAEFNLFMANDNLVHWYSQNCISDHPKMTRIPIGMDYHSIAAGKPEWGRVITPVEQEGELDIIIASAAPVCQRKIKCYVNFHFSIYPESPFEYLRGDVIADVSPDLVYYEEAFMKRADSWRKQVGYAFVLSPHGMGLDCHRTWEAILLGCIPIVRKSAIDSLYEDLPVLIVEQWSDITQALLEETIALFGRTVFSYNKLTMKYWMKKILEHK